MFPACSPHAHLALDLLGRVSEEDGGVGVTGTHLGLSALQGREEGRVQQGRLRMADPGGHVPGHPEVWVLGEKAWVKTMEHMARLWSVSNPKGVTRTGGCDAGSQFQTGSSPFNILSNTSALSRSLDPQPRSAS